MTPVIVFRNDLEWQQEAEVAKKYFPCYQSRMMVKPGDLVIARFSALPFFKEQEFDYNYIGAHMINTYEMHNYIADLGNWIWDLDGYTPKTWNEVSRIPDKGPFVLKGETNSKKFFWDTMMFAKDKKEAIAIHSKLTADSMLQYQKIYVREYVPLEKLTDGLQGLPITREYRFFIYKNKILSGGFYWSSHTEDIKSMGIKIYPEEVPQDFLQSVIDIVQSSYAAPVFWVLDVAKTQEGKWIVIELNDGCMSGLSDNDPEVLYSNLYKALNNKDECKYHLGKVVLNIGILRK